MNHDMMSSNHNNTAPMTGPLPPSQIKMSLPPVSAAASGPNPNMMSVPVPRAVTAAPPQMSNLQIPLGGMNNNNNNNNQAPRPPVPLAAGMTQNPGHNMNMMAKSQVPISPYGLGNNNNNVNANNGYMMMNPSQGVPVMQIPMTANIPTSSSTSSSGSGGHRHRNRRPSRQHADYSDSESDDSSDSSEEEEKRRRSEKRRHERKQHRSKKDTQPLSVHNLHSSSQRTVGGPNNNNNGNNNHFSNQDTGGGGTAGGGFNGQLGVAPKLELVKVVGIEMICKFEVKHALPRQPLLIKDGNCTWITSGMDIKLVGTSKFFHEEVRQKLREHLWTTLNGVQFKWKQDLEKKPLRQETRDQIEKAALQWPIFKKFNANDPTVYIELDENPDLSVVACWIAAEINTFLHNSDIDYGFHVSYVKLVDNKGLYGEVNVKEFHW